MTIHAKMRVVLEVDGKAMAESTDLGICAEVLRLLGAEADGCLEEALTRGGVDAPLGEGAPSRESPSGGATTRLAEEIEVPEGQLMGAIDPTEEPPFIRVNKRNWEGLVRGVPKRGRGAVSPLALVLTALSVWKDSAGLGRASVSEGLGILRALGLDDKNTKRSIANCEWLMERGDGVVLNPGMMSQSLEIVRALCEKRPPNLNEGEE